MPVHQCLWQARTKTAPRNAPYPSSELPQNDGADVGRLVTYRLCGRVGRSDRPGTSAASVTERQAEATHESPVASGSVSSDEPYVRLPDLIELTLAEAGELLEVLDVAVATARTEGERIAAREVAEMITAKLWPELGVLLNDDDEA